MPPPLTTSADSATLYETFLNAATNHPSDIVYTFAEHGVEGPERWRSRTYGESRTRIEKIAGALHTAGVTEGSAVAIISGTRPEWCEADMAILACGAVSVSVYPSLTAEEIGYILWDSGATVAIAENQEQLDKLLRIQGMSFLIPEREGEPSRSVEHRLTAIICIEDTSPHPLTRLLKDILNAPAPATPPSGYKNRNKKALASLVYTSGTTGAPKGVIQSHGNHLANVEQATASGMFAFDGDLFLYLPLAHSFARLIYYIGFLTPARLTFPCVASRTSSKLDMKLISRDMREANSVVVPSVPRLFEKAMATIINRAQASSLSGLLLRFCLWSSRAVHAARRASVSPGVVARIAFLGTQPIRDAIRKGIFGSRFSHAISGGAKLPEEVHLFFDSLGIDIFEGYGLTETCVATNVNRHGRRRIGSVGPLLDGVELRIAPEDGEILFRGPNISSGYWKRPRATAESWDNEGWFHTGDIGRVDSEGFLYITDRKKDLIVTAGGKKIPPLSLESRFKSNPIMSQVVVAGDGKPYCVALVTIDELEVAVWSKQRKITITKPYSQNKAVVAEINKTFEAVNSSLASYETVKRFAILDNDFTIDSGLLTASLKVKRKEVLKRYHREIESLYSAES